MRIQKLDEQSRKNLLEDLLKRSPNQYPEYESRVATILAAVRSEKDKAVFGFTKQFDGIDLTPETILVTEEEIREAYREVDPSLVEILRKAKKNIEEYHEKQKKYSWFDSKSNGTILG